MMAGSRWVLTFVLLPIKLSSTKKHFTPPARRVDMIQFSQDLIDRLGSNPVAEQRRHIAEVAVKRAAPGVLDSHASVFFRIHQIPSRKRGRLQVRFVVGGIDLSRRSVLQIVQKHRQGDLALFEHKMIHMGIQFGNIHKQGAPDDAPFYPAADSGQ